MGRVLKRGLVGLALVLLLALIYAVAGFNLDAFGIKSGLIRQSIEASPRPSVPVTTAEARSMTWSTSLPAIGTVEAVLGVDVAPQLAGRVVQFLFESGETVKKGAPLARLDDTVERAELAEARAQLRLAELNLERGRELVQRGNMSQANFDKARAERDVAQAQVDRIAAQIALKTVAAPFDGRLGIRQAHLGQYLAPGTMIVTLQSQDPIYINFRLPERELPRIRPGTKVGATIDGLGARVFAGEIKSIDAKIDQTTRNVAVQASFANPDGALVPGMFANVRVQLGESQNVVAVPETSVSYSLYGDSIFVVVPAKSANGTDALGVERRYVKIVARRDGTVALSEGVKAGERVVTSGQIRLVPGVNVVIDDRISLERAGERSRP